MCNLYQLSPKDDFEVYMRRALGRDLFLPDYQDGTVGPFGTGLFLRQGEGGPVGQLGQWGLIRKGQPGRIDYIQPKAVPGKKPRAPRARSTNNARIEAIDGDERKTNAATVWQAGRRCLIPAAWYQEPNWQTGKNIWWHLKRADGMPWLLAGLWSDDWVEPETGEVVPSFTMITVNCDDHPLLSRLHRPERDPTTNEILPPDQQDKRSLVHIDAAHWDTWLRGTAGEARQLLIPQPAEVFDQADALATDAALASLQSSDLFG